MRCDLRWMPAVVLVGLSNVISVAAHAQSVGNSCVDGPPAIPAATVAAFKADPGEFIKSIVASKQDVADTVRRIVKQDTSVVRSVPGASSPIDIALKALPDQQADIAKGLGYATKECIDAKHQDLGNGIQEAVLTQFSTAFQIEFSKASAEIRTTAIGGAGASPGASGGSVNALGGGGNNGGNFNFGPESTATSGYTQPNGGVTSLTALNSTSTTRSIAASASPTGVSSF